MKLFNLQIPTILKRVSIQEMAQNFSSLSPEYPTLIHCQCRLSAYRQTNGPDFACLTVSSTSFIFSGGKDSTVLAYVLKLLNERYDYGLNLFLLSIDEGITGYRDDSLETVKRNQVRFPFTL